MKKHISGFSVCCSVLWLLPSVYACMAPTCVLAQSARATSQEPLVSDQRVRTIAQKIEARDVLELRFYGPQMGLHFENDPITIRNARKIATFLNALRQASTRRLGLANRVNTLEIRFRPRKGHTREPVMLNFNTSSPADCFGPKFAAALRTILPQPPRAAR